MDPSATLGMTGGRSSRWSVVGGQGRVWLLHRLCMHAAISDGSLGCARDDSAGSSRWSVVGGQGRIWLLCQLCMHAAIENGSLGYARDDGVKSGR